MQFVKTHWISLASGLVALLAIAFTVLGMTRDSVITEMQTRLQTAGQLDMLRNTAKNEETIAAEKERGRQFDAEYTATLEAAATINQREPILEGVFPAPKQSELAYRFQESYREALYELPRLLAAGGLPSDKEIQEEVERLEEEARKKAEREPQPGEPGGAVPPAAPPVPPGGSFGPITPQPGAPPGMPWGPGGSPAPGLVRPAGPSTTSLNIDLNEARRLAGVRKARSIRVYADLNLQSQQQQQPQLSFHVSPIVLAERAPTPREMWHAQVSLWVQRDVANAIRKLNDEVAAQLAPGEACVANLPVKRILGLRVLGYVTPTGTVRFDNLGGGGGMASSEAPPTFTGRKSDAQFDIVRFTLSAIVDQRELLRLVDFVTRENFYQLVDLDYQMPVLPGQQQQAIGEADYHYGSGPVVLAALEFEGAMARKVYKDLMPDEVKRELGIEGAPPANP